MIYNIFKMLAFQIDPENAHQRTMSILSKFPKVSSEFFNNSELSSKYELVVGKNTWVFPVGLAAGMDKEASAVDFFSKIHFGSIEVGTVTPLPQEGNSRPRMWRYIEKESLRNCMGFNNAGAEAIYSNLVKANLNGRPLGVNLGKNKKTAEVDAHKDYNYLYEKFADLASYLVINVSSPNTPGLRNLQTEKGLRQIFDGLAELREEIPCPLYLKIAPDLSFADLGGIISLVREYKLTGIIATNTTIMEEFGLGGMSGKILSDKASKMRGEILKQLSGSSDIELIGVGGISCFDDLWDFWKQGGKVVQVLTAFIYQGPALLNNIKTEIDHVLEKNGHKTLQELLDNIDQAVR